MFKASLIGCLALILTSCTPGGEEPVATYQGGRIEGEEFAERYQKYLELTGSRDNIVLRKQIAENMINERLIFAELGRQGFDDRPETREFLEQVKTQALLDRYSKLAVAESLIVSDQEYHREFRSYNTKVTARYLYSPSQAGGRELKRRLDHGESFAALARECFRDPGLANNGGFLGTFGYGEMEPLLEQVAFTQPIGRVSDPFPMRVGYGLLLVESRKVNPLAGQSEFVRVKDELRHTIVHRKAAEALTVLSARLANELKPVFDSEAIRLIYDNWDRLFEAGNEVADLPSIGQRHLVSFSGGSWDVGRFVERARWTSDRQRGRVADAGNVQDVVTGLLVRDALLGRARAAGLETDPEVTAQIDNQYVKYRLDQWRAGVQKEAVDAIDDDQLLAEYQSRTELHTWPPQVNVAEVLLMTIDEAKRIAARARSGEDFRTLARENSIRLWAAQQGGELGFGGGAEFGPLAAKFLSVPVGTIIGPEPVDPYFGVFKVLDKRTDHPRSFEDAKEEIRSSLAAQKSQKALEDALAGLRRGADIRLNVEYLAAIPLAHHAGEQES